MIDVKRVSGELVACAQDTSDRHIALSSPTHGLSSTSRLAKSCDKTEHSTNARRRVYILRLWNRKEGVSKGEAG
jgi:hypothetical protein